LPAKTCSIVTQEAFETYWQHLDRNDGIIAVHASSRHINLFPVLQGLCAYFHADAAIVDVNTAQDPFETSYWVLLARHPGALNIPGLPPSGQMQIPPRLWTDDYSDIFRLIR
jgi:hypothetical protein